MLEDHFKRLHQYRTSVHLVTNNVVAAIVRDAAHKASHLMVSTAPPATAPSAEAADEAPAAVTSQSITHSTPEAETAAPEETLVAANAVEARTAAVVVQNTTTTSVHAAPENVSFLQPTATPVLRTNAEAPEIGTLCYACLLCRFSHCATGDALATRLYVLRAGPSGGGAAANQGNMRGPSMVKMEGSVNDQGVDVPLKKQAQKWKSAQV
jgi:hypothetical protein